MASSEEVSLGARFCSFLRSFLLLLGRAWAGGWAILRRVSRRLIEVWVEPADRNWTVCISPGLNMSYAIDDKTKAKYYSR